MDAYQITFIVAFVLGMLELLTGAFLFLGMAVGAVAVALLQWSTSGLSLNRDLLVFSLLSALAIGVLRKCFVRPANPDNERDVNRY